MAKAKKMLAGLKRFQEGGEVAEFPEEQASTSPALPTISEVVGLIGANRERFDDIVKGKPANQKDMTKNEVIAIRLLFAANQTPDPDRYLESLNAAYGPSQIDFDLNTRYSGPLAAALGYVDPTRPNEANIISFRHDLKNVIPHELEHTLQYGERNKKYTSTEGLSDWQKIGNQQSRMRNTQYAYEMLDRLNKMPEEQKKDMLIGGNIGQNIREIKANIADAAISAAARGEDFINTPMGKELFPDKRGQQFFFTNILPQVPSIYGFRENAGKEPPIVNKYDPNASYARRLLNTLGVPKKF